MTTLALVHSPLAYPGVLLPVNKTQCELTERGGVTYVVQREREREFIKAG